MENALYFFLFTRWVVSENSTREQKSYARIFHGDFLNKENSEHSFRRVNWRISIIGVDELFSREWNRTEWKRTEKTEQEKKFLDLPAPVTQNCYFLIFWGIHLMI